MTVFHLWNLYLNTAHKAGIAAWGLLDPGCKGTGAEGDIFDYSGKRDNLALSEIVKDITVVFLDHNMHYMKGDQCLALLREAGLSPATKILGTSSDCQPYAEHVSTYDIAGPQKLKKLLQQ